LPKLHQTTVIKPRAFNWLLKPDSTKEPMAGQEDIG